MNTKSEKIQTRINKNSTTTNIEEVPVIPFDDLSRDNLKRIIEDSMMPVGDLVRKKIEAEHFIMKPWIKKGSLVLVYGNAGIGKTLFTLSVAVAVTRKIPIGLWEVEKPVGCLYIDGEMALSDMKSRLQFLLENLPKEKASLKFLTSEEMAKKHNLVPNITNQKWRDAITDMVRKDPGIGLLIIDNVSSLAPNLNENSKQAWDDINQWQLSLRRIGKAVILIHHESIKGNPRGTTGRLDNIDSAIQLKGIPNGSEDEGANFQVIFKKKRSIFGKSAEPFCMMIKKDPDSGFPWKTSSAIGQNRGPSIIGLIGMGMKQRKIAEALGCTEPNVTQIKKKAMKEGWFTEEGKPTGKWHTEYSELTIEDVIRGYKEN